MSIANNYANVGYSLQQGPLSTLSPLPIIALRVPTTADKGFPLGQMWVYKTANSVFVLSSIVSNLATWTPLSTSGGAGTFTSLTVTPGPIALTGTTTINTTGAAATTIATGGTGALLLGNATGNTVVTGSLTATSLISTTTVTAGTGMTSTTGNIVATAGAVNAGTSMTATLGNITATNGNVVLSTATNKVVLPGPVDIKSGAGAPAGALALHIGDVYINTTAASAVTRMYIADSVGSWVNVTCSA